MIKVLSISYGRHLFDGADKERQRMEACAAKIEGYHMVVFTSHSDGLIMTKGENGLELHPTSARLSLLQPLTALYTAGRVIRSDRAATWVVTTQDSFVAGFVGWMLAIWFRLPLNVQEHGGEFNGPYWRQYSVYNRALYQLGRFILRQATTIRVVSQRSKDTLLDFGHKPEQLLFLPVRSDQIEVEAQANPVKLGFASDTVVILTLARLVPQKNLPILIEAVATLAKDGLPVGLCVVGNGSEETRLKKLVEKLGIVEQVKFVTWTDTPAAYYAAGDIYALTSDWEGWARVLPEAMAHGLPIVATDVGCAGEVVVDGEHGFVVPVRALNRFTERLRTLVKDESLRLKFGQQAKEDSRKLQTSLDEYATAWANVLVITEKRFHQKN